MACVLGQLGRHAANDQGERGTQKWRISSCTTWKEVPFHHAWVQLAGPPHPWMGWMGLKCFLGPRSLLVNARPSWKWRTGNLVLGGSRSGGWRQVVSGSEVVYRSAGQSPPTVRAMSAPAQDATCVETEVVLHPLVCRCSLVCHVSAWAEGDSWY